MSHIPSSGDRITPDQANRYLSPTLTKGTEGKKRFELASQVLGNIGQMANVKWNRIIQLITTLFTSGKPTQWTNNKSVSKQLEKQITALTGDIKTKPMDEMELSNMSYNVSVVREVLDGLKQSGTKQDVLDSLGEDFKELSIELEIKLTEHATKATKPVRVGQKREVERGTFVRKHEAPSAPTPEAAPAPMQKTRPAVPAVPRHLIPERHFNVGEHIEAQAKKLQKETSHASSEAVSAHQAPSPASSTSEIAKPLPNDSRTTASKPKIIRRSQKGLQTRKFENKFEIPSSDKQISTSKPEQESVAKPAASNPRTPSLHLTSGGKGISEESPVKQATGVTALIRAKTQFVPEDKYEIADLEEEVASLEKKFEISNPELPSRAENSIEEEGSKQPEKIRAKQAVSKKHLPKKVSFSSTNKKRPSYFEPSTSKEIQPLLSNISTQLENFENKSFKACTDSIQKAKKELKNLKKLGLRTDHPSYAIAREDIKKCQKILIQKEQGNKIATDLKDSLLNLGKALRKDNFLDPIPEEDINELNEILEKHTTLKNVLVKADSILQSIERRMDDAKRGGYEIPEDPYSFKVFKEYPDLLEAYTDVVNKHNELLEAHELEKSGMQERVAPRSPSLQPSGGMMREESQQATEVAALDLENQDTIKTLEEGITKHLKDAGKLLGDVKKAKHSEGSEENIKNIERSLNRAGEAMVDFEKKFGYELGSKFSKRLDKIQSSLKKIKQSKIAKGKWSPVNKGGFQVGTSERAERLRKQTIPKDEGVQVESFTEALEKKNAERSNLALPSDYVSDEDLAAFREHAEDLENRLPGEEVVAARAESEKLKATKEKNSLEENIKSPIRQAGDLLRTINKAPSSKERRGLFKEINQALSDAKKAIGSYDTAGHDPEKFNEMILNTEKELARIKEYSLKKPEEESQKEWSPDNKGGFQVGTSERAERLRKPTIPKDEGVQVESFTEALESADLGEKLEADKPVFSEKALDKERIANEKLRKAIHAKPEIEIQANNILKKIIENPNLSHTGAEIQQARLGVWYGLSEIGKNMQEDIEGMSNKWKTSEDILHWNLSYLTSDLIRSVSETKKVAGGVIIAKDAEPMMEALGKLIKALEGLLSKYKKDDRSNDKLFSYLQKLSISQNEMKKIDENRAFSVEKNKKIIEQHLENSEVALGNFKKALKSLNSKSDNSAIASAKTEYLHAQRALMKAKEQMLKSEVALYGNELPLKDYKDRSGKLDQSIKKSNMEFMAKTAMKPMASVHDTLEDVEAENKNPQGRKREIMDKLIDTL